MIFVTLNPAGKGYGGRSKLPDNLKALFREISMALPNKNLLSQVLLFNVGFQNSKVLSEKLVTVFDLAHQLQSKQRHYDRGLRAQKAVVNMAGQWLSQDNKTGEEQIVVKALMFDTLAKLDDRDRKLFIEIVKDIFGKVPEDAQVDLEFENAYIKLFVL